MTIDWAVTAAVLDRLLAAGPAPYERLRARADTVDFRNAPYPLSPLPVYITAGAADSLSARLEAYGRVLRKVIAAYRADPEVRHWYGLSAAGERLVLADEAGGDDIAIARFDGYLIEGEERHVVLENNADAPAGTMFTTRLNRVVDGALADVLGAGVPATGAPSFTDETELLDVIARRVRARLDRDPRAVAILQLDGAANRESVAMAEAFTVAGVPTFVADPRSLDLRDGVPCFGGRPADACWNKVNTDSWERAVATDSGAVEAWEQVLRGGAMVAINPFGARYVAESKLCLAFVREPSFVASLDAAERALIAEVLPWGCRAGPDATAAVDGDEMPLDRALRTHPAEFVLKQPYDIRGDGVTIGRGATPAEWANAVDAAFAAGHLVQRRVAPARYPVTGPDTPCVVAMPISLDAFVFDGEVRGYGAKASLGDKVNVFRGGRKLAVRVTA